MHSEGIADYTASPAASTASFSTKTIPYSVRAGLLLISFIVLATLVTFGSRDVRASLGRWSSDHFSHWGSTILLPSVGWDIYRKPVKELCGQLGSSDFEQLRDLKLNPADGCLVPNQVEQRAFLINWQDFPRPYPPGIFVYSLPEALLWKHTNPSLHRINQITIIKYLIAAHLAVFFAWLVLFPAAGPLPSMAPLPISSQWVLMPLIYFELTFWSMSGIYDSIAILFGFLGLFFWRPNGQHFRS